MSDIVKRLRSRDIPYWLSEITNTAADEIVRLRKCLQEAVVSHNEDTDCLMTNDSTEEDCPDGRCEYGCIVARVNRWRDALMLGNQR